MPTDYLPRRVLIIDDNRDAAVLIAEILELHGHRTATAFDGTTGLALATEFVADIVLLDLNMPGMDGYAVAETLRRRFASAVPVLVAFTACCDAASRARAAACGIDHYVVKPVPLAVLLDTVILGIPTN